MCQGEEGVVFFGRFTGKRLEPVGEVRTTVLLSPFFHANCYHISDFTSQFLSALNGSLDGEISFFRQVLLHRFVVEDIFPEIGSDCFGLSFSKICRNRLNTTFQGLECVKTSEGHGYV